MDKKTEKHRGTKHPRSDVGRQTEKYRDTKSGAKGADQSADRTAQGVAYTPVRYEPGNAQIGDMVGYHRHTMDDLLFLDAYEEAKADLDQIKAVTGFSKKKITNILQKDNIRAEIAELQSVWRLNRKMKAEYAAAKHIELMGELETDYRLIDDVTKKAPMANARVKASETYLRAAGHFTHGGGEADTQVVINIDLGGDAENEKKINISGEKK